MFGFFHRRIVGLSISCTSNAGQSGQRKRKGFDFGSVCAIVMMKFDFVIKPCQKQMRPFLRVLAAGWLFVWLAALGACSTEALCDYPHDGSDEGGVQHGEHHDDSSHHACSDNPFCQSLKSAGLSQPLANLVKPDFHQLHFLPPKRCELSLQLLPKPAIFRHPSDRVLPFTPELCLGPAYRSLAPPVIS